MNEENEKKTNIDFSHLSWSQLMELDSCTRCGQCVTWCPVYKFDENENITPRAKINAMRRLIRSQNSLINKIFKPGSLLGNMFGLKVVPDKEIDVIAENFYECSTCRQCHFVCPSRIDTVELYEAIRRCLVDAGYGPLENHKGLITSSNNYDNPWQQPRSHRDRWTRVAKREKRIDNIPTMLKPPKNFLKNQTELK